MKSRFDIVIVGGGAVGLTLASRLLQSAEKAAFQVTLLDGGSRPEFDASPDIALRVSAIAPGSVALFDKLGIWRGVAAARACPFRSMRVWDAARSVEGPETLRFDAAEFGVPQLGFIVENDLLRHALCAKVENGGATLRFDTRIDKIAATGDRFELLLHDGTSLRPDLLVGADGATSFVRKHTGIDVRSWPYAQKAFVTHCRPEKNHADTAWQRFLADGPIGLLPLSDGRVSIVWSTTAANVAAALAAGEERLAALLTAATDGVLGVLRPAGPRGSFPLRAQHAKRYVRPGLALIGDAAHAVHPLAGQGANLGLADAEVLASVLETAAAAGANPADLPVLRRYERARKGANATMLYFVDGLNRLFSNESASLARVRAAGLVAFNNSGPVRQRVVQVALGMR